MSRSRRFKESHTVCKFTCESIDNVLPYLVTTWSSSCPNRYSKVRRMDTELRYQATDSDLNNRRQRPSPPGMHSCECASLRIAHQYRNTIGRFNPGEDARSIAND